MEGEVYQLYTNQVVIGLLIVVNVHSFLQYVYIFHFSTRFCILFSIVLYSIGIALLKFLLQLETYGCSFKAVQVVKLTEGVQEMKVSNIGVLILWEELSWRIRFC